MSHPITIIEKKEAVETHERNIIKEKAVNSIHEGLKNRNPKYDLIGMYPPVPKLVAIGDLHGDIMITLSVLKLAEVIPQTSTINNINGIHWSGGSTWVIQLGDQIDRCRPEDWDKNCIKDYDDVYEDEGNNMLIIQIFQKLDAQARKVGGRVLGMLGNHELMNVDRDFRYVSPKEFLEFVPANERNRKKTDDGLPYGYYHRMKVFERGGNIAKHYAMQKKSVIMVGKNLFAHGGFTHDLASKYSLHEINEIVKKWLLKQTNDREDEIFDEIFRDDDDMSPFWCRTYSEDDGLGENTEKGFNKLLQILNRRNKKFLNMTSEI